MAEEKYNMKNPAVKRILQEVKEMQNNPIADYMSLPLEVRWNSFA
jgi:ubiquitin-conjugating enzyme E2 J1